MIIFFWMNPPNFFFQLKTNKYCLGVETGSCAPGDKKVQLWIICGSTRCIPLHAATATESNVIKKQKGHASY